MTQRLDQAVDDLDATIKDIRRSIFALAATQGSHDIQVEVSRLVERAAGTLKFRPTLLFEGPVRTLVDGDLAPDLLAVLGEALSNASRHSGATRRRHRAHRRRGRGAVRRRRRPRPRGRRARERPAQHARAGQAPGRQPDAHLRPRPGHHRDLDGACRHAVTGLARHLSGAGRPFAR